MTVSRYIPFAALLFLTFSAASSRANYTEVDQIYPLEVFRGYPVIFLSNFVGGEYGYAQPEFGYTHAEPTYREIQVRQTDDSGAWGPWTNVEAPSPEVGVSTQLHYLNTSSDAVTSEPVLISGDRVQVRHRVNNKLAAGKLSFYEDLVGEWKTFDVTVRSDGYEAWIDPYDYSEVSEQYLSEFPRLDYELMGDRPDYHHLPYYDLQDPEGSKIYPEPLADLDYPQPPDAWREAYLQRVNFLRRLSGVAPTHRAAAEFELAAQMASLDMHVHYHINHTLYAPDPDLSGHVPLDDPRRDYYPQRGEEIFWAVRHGSLSILSNRTVEAQGGNDYWDRGFGAHPVDAYYTPVMEFFDDAGIHNMLAGHRRALLNPLTTELAVGSTLATYLGGVHHPTINDPGSYQGQTYPETHVVVDPGQAYSYFTKLHGYASMFRDNGVLYPAPGLVPYELVTPRITGDAVKVELPEGVTFSGIHWEQDSKLKTDVRSGGGPSTHKIQAKVWRNGEPMLAKVTIAELNLIDSTLEFAIDMGGEFEDRTLTEELEETYPDLVRHLYMRFVAGASPALYPRPRSGTDEFRVEITLELTEEDQDYYNLPASTPLLEYAFYPYVPHVAFDDDTHKVGDFVHSERMGWYTVDAYPWIYLYEQRVWGYASSTPETINLWVYDVTLGWLYTGPDQWRYSPSRGWLYYQPESRAPRWFYEEAKGKWRAFNRS